MTALRRSPRAGRAPRGSALAPALRDRWMTVVFVAFSFALAFWQRPGISTSDTKIDLHVDPARFLAQVASVWTPTTDLGEVHSAQYAGYLWPMGPFFAVGNGLGIGSWVVERLWLGLMFALAAWGMLRLLDALFGRPRGVAHATAAAFYLLNPYVTVFTARTTITLLGYAALPWLLLITYHGVRATRSRYSWRWAAIFALVLTSTGGGVNAAVVGWMLVGPLVLIIYEPLAGAVPWRRSLGFLAQVAVCGLLVSLWWIVPLLVHVRFGIDFLQFTEQPGSIWGTNSASESLRLMGYWTSYIGVGFGTVRAYFSDSATLLFNPLVVGAGLLLPALAVLAASRRRTVRDHLPFLLALLVVGALITTAGFPNGTPVRHTMDWIYAHVFVLRFMRTTNKAVPLIAVGVAGLLGLGASAAVAWGQARAGALARRSVLVAGAAALAALLVLASLPLIRGDAMDKQLLWKRIPSAWRQAGTDLDRHLPGGTRAIVLPGQVFAYYHWGGTIDAILPRLTRRPVAIRYETPYSDLHAVDLLTTIDDLVQERRLVPGELPGLLRLISVGAVVSGADDDLTRSGALDPAAFAGELAGQGLGAPQRSFGTQRAVAPAEGDVGPSVRLPEVRRYAVSGSRPIVHVDPIGDPTIVDGSAATLADLSGFGALPAHTAILYAGDQTPARLRAAAAQGADLVVGDSNRRAEFVPQTVRQNAGPVLDQADAVASTQAVINPFAKVGSDGQTVLAITGARYVRAPSAGGGLQFPEHGPLAAFDGDLSTAWEPARLGPVRHPWVEIGLPRPRDVSYVDVAPLQDAHGVTDLVDVNGVRHPVGPGLTRIPVSLHHVSAIRVTIDHVRQPRVGFGSPGGIREIAIPGVRVQSRLRVPIALGRDLTGVNLAHDSLTYALERVTGDDPWRRDPYGTVTALRRPQDAGDPERVIDRVLFTPAARRYTASAWVYPALATSDAVLDRLAGYRGGASFTSSSRFEDQPANRASSAFGAVTGAGWMGFWDPFDAPLPWIAWHAPRMLTVAHLRVLPSRLAVRHPTEVALRWPGGASGPLPVAADGTVTLPVAARAHDFRLTVLAAALPAGATPDQQLARAVAIGRLIVPGLAPVAIAHTGPVRGACGMVAVSVAGHRVALRPSGNVAQLDAGRPLLARPCGAAPSVAMPAGINEVRALPGVFDVDLMRLRSPAPDPLAVPAAPGQVTAQGQIGTSGVSGVRVRLAQPAWLVLGESYDAGWQASCDGRSLGAPQVLDGYGNGWRAPAGCRSVSFSFGPQHSVEISYAISAAAALAMLLALAIGAVRRRRSRARSPVASAAADPPAGASPPAAGRARVRRWAAGDDARTAPAARGGGAGHRAGPCRRLRVRVARRCDQLAAADAGAVAAGLAAEAPARRRRPARRGRPHPVRGRQPHRPRRLQLPVQHPADQVRRALGRRDRGRAHRHGHGRAHPARAASRRNDRRTTRRPAPPPPASRASTTTSRLRPLSTRPTVHEAGA